MSPDTQVGVVYQIIGISEGHVELEPVVGERVRVVGHDGQLVVRLLVQDAPRRQPRAQRAARLLPAINNTANTDSFL